MTTIPILDLTRARRRIDAALAERWKKVMDGNSYIQGPEVKELEASFARFLDARAVVGVANGTDALVVALRALGLQHGAEVLVPAFSFFATAEAVVLAGGVPVFCDIDAATYNLDPAELERHATAKTAGVIGVHLYGRPFDAESVSEICRRRGWFLVEDAAQAHGARRRGKRVGTLGDLAAWSFYPTKNLGCFGDGGAISGMDEALMQRVYRFANHGQSERYTHVEIGTNSRLDSLQAAVLNCRLPLLDDDNARRRQLAALYKEGLESVGDLRFPPDDPQDEVVYHQMTIATSHRDALQEFLKVQGVGSAVHYPSPLHRQKAMAELLPKPPQLPRAEKAASEVLCLPMYPELEENEVLRTADAVRAFFASRS
ncbi:MAG: DegT/DnrJ/EryC1/StrS family aminotransferase [Thermoanaerobaculia bacterium]